MIGQIDSSGAQSQPQNTDVATLVAEEQARGKEPEKAQAEVRVNTPGYRLETVGPVKISPRQQLEIEAAFWCANVLNAFLRKNGIGTTQPEGTVQSTKSYEEIFRDDVYPIITEMAAMFPKDKISDSELQERMKTMRQKVNMETLMQQDAVHVFTVTGQDKGEQSEKAHKVVTPVDMEDLFGIWIHDIKGKAQAPHLMLQLFEKKRAAILAAGGNPDTDTVMIEKKQGIEDTAFRTLQGLYGVLETGLPFTIETINDLDSGPGETLAELAEQDPYPRSPVSLDTFVPMIQEAILESGQLVNIHIDKVFALLGSELQVNWNTNWARRFIENIISNAQKAHEDSDTDPASRFVDVYLGVVDGNLVVLFGDRGDGYPKDMLEGWEDPAKRASVQAGWRKQEIASTGLGFRGHAAITEEQYDGHVWLYNWGPDGGAATIVTMPLINPPAPDLVQQIEKQ